MFLLSFLQEYESENIVHTWRWPCRPKHIVWTSTTKHNTIYNKAACRRQLNPKSSWVTRWLGCVFSPALYLELRRVISSLMVGICRSLTAFGTYHGASVIRRRAFDWKGAIISMFEVEAVPHSWTPYVHMGKLTPIVQSRVSVLSYYEIQLLVWPSAQIFPSFELTLG
jgi:hypothetical protein